MKIERRELGTVFGGIIFAAAGIRFSFAEQSQDAITFTEDQLALLGESAGQEELKMLVSEGFEVAGLGDRVKSTRKIAPKAVALIVASEVSSKSTYQQKYQGVIWPKEASGPTIGIGYDLGYVTRNNFRADWQDYVSKAVIDQLSPLCGVTGSKSTGEISKIGKHPAIDFDVAYSEFINEVLPRYTDETEKTLKNCNKLTDKQLGVLVSLSYNRGFSYRIPVERDRTGRYKEMRNISKHMSDENFKAIPGEFVSMKRLWENNPKVRGVALRRQIEADMFEEDLV